MQIRLIATDLDGTLVPAGGSTAGAGTADIGGGHAPGNSGCPGDQAGH